MKKKKFKKVFIFTNKNLLALALLEIYLWHQQSKRFAVKIDEEKGPMLYTSSNDVIDIITEVFVQGSHYIVKESDI